MTGDIQVYIDGMPYISLSRYRVIGRRPSQDDVAFFSRRPHRRGNP